MEDFGQLVRDRRRQEKLSQEELAQQVGISRNYLSQIERGQATNLSWQLREKISAILGLKEAPPPNGCNGTGLASEFGGVCPGCEFAAR